MKQILLLGEGYAFSNIKRYILYALFISAWITLPMDMTQAQSSKKDTSKSIQDTVFQLDEVEVSTGYQTIPKERATGSFVHIDSALFNRAVSTDVISRLKGIAPSLLFDERAGGAPKLSIRGRSTIFANADPLIVVDNFPYEGNLSNLNPNDIADVSILRDAAAASIWGVRAGNGVIVITTKKGKRGQPMQISLNSNVTIGEKPDLYYIPRLSARGQIELEEFLYAQGYYTTSLSNMVTYPLVPPSVEILADGSLSDTEKKVNLAALAQNDIRKEMERYYYQTNINQQYALNIQGGTEKHSYYVSAGYDKDRASEVGNASQRISLQARNTFWVLPQLEVNTDFSLVQGRTVDNSGVASLTTASIYERLSDDHDQPLAIGRNFRPVFLENAAAEGRLSWDYIPLQDRFQSDRRSRQNHYRINSQVRYILLPGLAAQVQYQYEVQDSHTDNFYGADSYYVHDLVNRYASQKNGHLYYNLPLGAILNRDEGNLDAHNGRFLLTDQRRIGPGEWNLLAGIEVREAKTTGFGSTRFGYDPSNGTSIPVNLDSSYRQFPSGIQRLSAIANQGITGSLERFRSTFFNGSYFLLGKYSFSGSARMDQTNLFGVKTNQRTVPLWSTGFKWDLHKEAFYAISWLPQLSARLTYGYNGNFDGTAKAYATATYATNQYGFREAKLGSLPNSKLRGEKNAVLNAGVDFGFGQALFYGRIDYYLRKGRDLIGTGLIDPTLGSSALRGNLADMNGKGLDIELNSQQQWGAWGWSSHLLFSYTADQVTHYEYPTSSGLFSDASLLGYNTMPVVGKPLFGIYSYRWAGIDPETGDPLGFLNGEVSKDYTGIQNSITSAGDLQYNGRATPSIFGAFRNDVRFKRFSLSVNIAYKLGYYFRRASVNYTGLISINGAKHPDYELRWQQPGDEQHTQVPSFIYPVVAARSSFYQNASVLIEKGDHIRLQDVQLSYSLGRWQCYVYANNLGILWRANHHGIDPDYNQNSASGSTTLPASRSIAIGIQTHF